MLHLEIKSVDGPPEVPGAQGLFGSVEKAQKVALGCAECRHDPTTEVVMVILDEANTEIDRVILPAEELPIVVLPEDPKGDDDEGDNQDA